MEFTFSAEQEELRRSVRDVLQREGGTDHVRAMMDDPRGFTDHSWAVLVELGWTGLLVPERHGGLGLGLVDLVVVQEEMGRLPWPGPYFSSAVLATLAARSLGLDDQLGSLAAGRSRGTVALEELGYGDPLAAIATRAVRRGGQWLLNGLKPVVPDGHTADWVLVVARTAEGLATFLVEHPDATPVPGWDLTRKLARLELRDTPGVPVGPAGDQTALWRRVIDDAAVALAAELTGVMQQANHLAVEYAKVRVQFDRPIATFQAIKHKTVDMLQRETLAMVGTHYAAWASDVDDPVRAEAAAMAKACAAESAVFVTSECIQVHGGVGFTWACDAHLFYKRAKQNDLLLGYQGWQRSRVADSYLATA